jgi:thioredoxin reductase
VSAENEIRNVIAIGSGPAGYTAALERELTAFIG